MSGPETPPDTNTASTRKGSNSVAYQVLARKYRPKTFSELIGQGVLVRTLTNAFKLNRLAHGFILTGVRGTGKTTTARIIARSLNCVGPDGHGGPTADPCGVCENCSAITADRHVDVLEMDAASRTGDNHGAVIRTLSVFLKPNHGNRGSETRSANGHDLSQIKAVWHSNNASRWHTGHLSIAAVAGLRETATTYQHTITGLESITFAALDRTGKINPAIKIGHPQNLGLPRGSQGILEIDARVSDADNDISLRQIADLHLLKPGANALLLLVYSESLERHL